VFAALLNLIFPPVCLFCRRPLLLRERQAFICGDCSKKKPFFQQKVCPVCSAPPDAAGCCRREERSFTFTGTLALGPYRGELKECLHRFKYRGRRELAGPLGELLASKIMLAPWHTRLNGVVPIPLHTKRLKERGYNQSLLLAQRISSLLALPLLDILVRIRETPPQAGLSGYERRFNVKGAFGLNNNAAQYQGLVLLLVDDVFTTGATLEEAASLLSLAGIAAETYNAVVAR